MTLTVQDFLQIDLPALLVAVFSAVSCGLLGNYLVLRRQALVGDAISHLVLPGIVVGFLLAGTLSTLAMMGGALGAAVLGVFLFDLFILRNGWCGHLCPLGAFYAVVGRVAQLRIRFDTPTCTHCGECARICPEPQVLNLREAAEAGMVASGECTNCGRCIMICPEDTLHFDLRRLINTDNDTATTEHHSRRAA